MKKYLLEGIVFICGAVVMIFEIVGSRVLGPYLGTSIFIWTSLIGIILGSLSLGYWAGGRMADKKPGHSQLAGIIFFSSIFIGITTLFKDILLNALPSVLPGLKGQAVLSALLLFAPASILLGMVSPYAVRLKIKSLQTSGTTVGNLYAVSTVGSITGTFGAGFFLIPVLGTNNLLFSLAALLCLTAVIVFFADHAGKKSIYAGIWLAGIIYLAVGYNSRPAGFIDQDTAYNRVWVYDAIDKESGMPVKFMRINNESSSAIFTGSDSLVFPYTKFYRLAEHFTPGFKHALILGGAAYSFPKYFLRQYPDATIDVVEIDPQLTELAMEHFHLVPDPRLRIHHEDGRTFINRTDNSYDVIYGDAFRSLFELPWHLTTVESVKKCHKMLNEGGVMLVNIISPIQGRASQFLQAELATFRQVFGQVFVFAVNDFRNLTDPQSLMLVALKDQQAPDWHDNDPLLNSFLGMEITDLIDTTMPVLTDDHAPVDYYVNKAIR